MSIAPDWTAEYVGLPFKTKGRDRTGVDCWGLVRLVLMERFGLDLPSCADDYADALEREEVARLINDHRAPWCEVNRGTAREGDVVLMRMVGAACHVGVVVAPGLMLHIEDGIDASIERYQTMKWERRVVGIYRWAEAA